MCQTLEGESRLTNWFVVPKCRLNHRRNPSGCWNNDEKGLAGRRARRDLGPWHGRSSSANQLAGGSKDAPYSCNADCWIRSAFATALPASIVTCRTSGRFRCSCSSVSDRQTQRSDWRYLSGTYIELREAPMPGVPWTTFLFVIMNSPR